MEGLFQLTFINPLEIPKIRQQILDFLPIHELKSPRLVNHEWNHEVCTILRKKSHILLNSFEDLLKFMRSFRQSLELPFKSFIFGSELITEITESYENSDFTAFCEEYGYYVNNIHLNFGTITQTTKELLRNIIEIKFPNLESLSLLLTGGSYRDVFEDYQNETLLNTSTITLKSSTLPKIKSLNIHIPGFDKKHTDDDLQIFITSCFRKFINLETISCTVTPKSNCVMNFHRKNHLINASFSHLNQHLSESILQSIVYISCNANDKDKLRRLSHLEILFKISDNELKSLGNGHVLLQTCYLELDSTVKASTLFQFLSTHKNSLEILYIEFSEESSFSIEINFLMPYLKKISLSRYAGLLNFLEKCPSIEDFRLENLSMNEDKNSCWNTDIRSSCSSAENLRYFKLHHSHKEFGDEELAKSVSEWFPNVTTLELHGTNDDVLRGVFKNLRGLKHVIFTGKDITDKGICGDTDKILKILMNSMMMQTDESFQDYGCASLSQVLEFKPTFPYIGDLTNLQSCKIDCNLISDAAIIFGLLRCKRLKRLYLYSCFELITSIGVSRLSELEDLVELNVFVRNIGWITRSHR